MKHFFLAFLFLSFLFLCACQDMSSDFITEDNFSLETSAAPQISDVILLDNESTKVIFNGVTDAPSLGVFYLNLNITNNLPSEVVATLESADVDGEQIPLITTGLPVNIRSGNSAAGSFIFSMVNLSIDSVAQANQASFKLVLRNAESFDVVYESDLLTVNLH